MLQLLDFNENPNIGIYCRTNDSFVFLQRSLSKKTKQLVGNVLGANVLELCIADSTIIGSLLVCNSVGAIITEFASKDTIALLEKQGLRVYPIKDVINAAGNDILVIGQITSGKMEWLAASSNPHLLISVLTNFVNNFTREMILLGHITSLDQIYSLECKYCGNTLPNFPRRGKTIECNKCNYEQIIWS